MILFVTNQDSSTRPGYQIALALTRNNQQYIALLEQDASREKLNTVLAQSALPLLAFSHGRADSLVDQGSTSALSVDDTELLQDRIVYAFAVIRPKG